MFTPSFVWRCVGVGPCMIGNKLGNILGIQLQRSSQALTDLRFADDILLFALSLQQILEMLRSLVACLRQVGLVSNASKTFFFLARSANVLGRRPSLPQPDSVGTLTGRARICHLHVRDWLSRWPLPVQRDPRQPDIPREQHTIHATPTQDW